MAPVKIADRSARWAATAGSVSAWSLLASSASMRSATSNWVAFSFNVSPDAGRNVTRLRGAATFLAATFKFLAAAFRGLAAVAFLGLAARGIIVFRGWGKKCSFALRDQRHIHTLCHIEDHRHGAEV
jgi:hypothetical protein